MDQDQTLHMNPQQPDKAEVMRQLAEQLPLNDFALPIGIYRADLLPWHSWEIQSLDALGLDGTPDAALAALDAPEDLDPPIEFDEYGFGIGVDPEDGSGNGVIVVTDSSKEPQPQPQIEVTPAPKSIQRLAGFPTHEIESAFEVLYYTAGYPTLGNGVPFWDQLPYQSPEAYQYFLRYLQMQFGTAGNWEEEDAGMAASGERSISVLASNMSMKDTELLPLMEKFHSCSSLYYWGYRAKAYDLYKIAAHRRQQELRAIETQDSDYVHARRLKAKLLAYIDDEEDFWDMLTPKVALDMLKTVTSMERISAGLPAQGPLITKEGSTEGGKSFEVLFKQAAQNNNQDSTILDEDGNILIERALNDPDTVEHMQQLIVKINSQ